MADETTDETEFEEQKTNPSNTTLEKLLSAAQASRRVLQRDGSLTEVDASATTSRGERVAATPAPDPAPTYEPKLDHAR